MLYTNTPHFQLLFPDIFCSYHACFLGVLQTRQVLQTGISSLGPLCLLLPLPRMISLQISARLAFLTPASLCFNVTFSEKTYLTLPITLPWFFYSTYYYVKCYTFYLLALCILLPKEQKLSSDFKNYLHMVEMK